MNGALAKLLADLRGRQLVALLNRGNRGDGLTQLGGRRLIASTGVTCREVYQTDDLSTVAGDVLLIYGAAASVRGVHSLARLMVTLAPRFAEIVVLPSSFDLEQPAVRAFARLWDRKYTVFCQELVSFDAVRRDAGKPKALLLGHDLAFHVDVNAWGARPASGRAGLFRHDEQAAYGRLPSNLDVVEDAAFGTEREPERLLDFVARFAEIHTDRAHAAMAAAMMGRKVVLYRCRQFKNRAIYDHSLAGLTHVRFVNDTPFSLRQFSRVLYWARMRPVQQRMRRLFHGGPAIGRA